MSSKLHYSHFEIKHCTHLGCINHTRQGCRLNLLSIEKYGTLVEGLHNPTMCQARRQNDLHMTERMLHE